MGSTPVLLAVKKGHEDIVSILTKKGANFDLLNKVSFSIYNNYVLWQSL